jgi:hypothetical protein
MQRSGTGFKRRGVKAAERLEDPEDGAWLLCEATGRDGDNGTTEKRQGGDGMSGTARSVRFARFRDAIRKKVEARRAFLAFACSVAKKTSLFTFVLLCPGNTSSVFKLLFLNYI